METNMWLFQLVNSFAIATVLYKTTDWKKEMLLYSQKR